MTRLVRGLTVAASLWLACGGMAALAEQPLPPSGLSPSSLASRPPVPVELEVLAIRADGAPVTGLAAAQLQVFDDGEVRGDVAMAPVGNRHLLLIVDLSTTTPAERHGALPALRSFLVGRAAQGDRITVAVLDRRSEEQGPEPLCRFCAEPAEVGRALDALAQQRSAAFHLQKQLQVDPRRQIQDAFLALANGLNLARGDGRATSLFYLGAASGAGLGAVEGPSRLAGGGGDVDATNVVGSVQYLVSMPRAGPPSSIGRSHADRLLATALEANVTIYPLVADRQASTPAGDRWLARETGGEILSIRHLRPELERLGRQLDHAYQLTFASAADQRFHQLEVRGRSAKDSGDRDYRVRHRRGYRAVVGDEVLMVRSQAAWLLQASDDDLGLSAELEGGRIDGDQMAVNLQLLLPVPATTATANSATAGHLTLSLAVADEDSPLVVQVRPLPYRRAADQELLRLRIPLRLPSGVRGLGLALRDDESGRISSMVLHLSADSSN